VTYISISAVDKVSTKTFSASKINDEEKQKAKDFIDSLDNDAEAGGDATPA
jgi:hypothetical protein